VLRTPEGAADLSYYWGAWFSPNATPILTTTVAAPTKMASFLMGCFLRPCHDFLPFGGRPEPSLDIPWSAESRAGS
jgi:hypothetical protein